MWQPIETAPKDGTWLLVYGDRDCKAEAPPIGVSQWVKEFYDRWDLVNDNTQKRVVVDDSHWSWESDVYNPTHWMPLPEPPK